MTAMEYPDEEQVIIPYFYHSIAWSGTALRYGVALIDSADGLECAGEFGKPVAITDLLGAYYITNHGFI